LGAGSPTKKLKEIDGAIQGALAIGTGVGKTTHTVSCLCKGKKQNIILVVPTQELVYSAERHHSD
jgi:reverse gyrase